MFGLKKTKKNEGREQVFKREAYIPKKKLTKKERTVPQERGRKGESEISSQNGILRKIVVLILWILFIGEVAYVLLFAGFFTIATVQVQRENESDQITENQIREYVEESWKGGWLGVIPRNNLLFVHPAKEERRVLERYPKLQAVSIDKHFPDRLVVSVSEKPYQILWCRGEECFLVNTDGKTEDADIFFRYPEEQGKAVRIQDTAEATVGMGTQVLAPEDQQFIGALISDFSLRTGLEIEGSLERPNPYAREMRIRTNEGFLIFFNTRLSVTDSLNTLMLVLKKEIPEDEWEKIEYIDLRTENRIYYTRKDKAPEKTEAQKQREEEEEKKRKEEEEKNKDS